MPLAQVPNSKQILAKPRPWRNIKIQMTETGTDSILENHVLPS
jgi:hypothetical protein